MCHAFWSFYQLRAPRIELVEVCTSTSLQCVNTPQYFESGLVHHLFLQKVHHVLIMRLSCAISASGSALLAGLHLSKTIFMRRSWSGHKLKGLISWSTNYLFFLMLLPRTPLVWKHWHQILVCTCSRPLLWWQSAGFQLPLLAILDNKYFECLDWMPWPWKLKSRQQNNVQMYIWLRDIGSNIFWG